MDDLISREDVKRLTTKRNNIWNEVTDAEGRGLDEILESLPSIDAVPVVRCKDCKIRYTDRCGMFDVEAEWEWTEDNGFCQYGERKESK